ncbi:MAG: glycoside hydrolase family 3 C-terminal domain-containing protein, partial [Oscillospiraceae bacterium]|nr:glycoside hydrolase family 3 C-terminal domain-containing protein [Oscillospiraceae bacterium]
NIPASKHLFNTGTYDGKEFADAGVDPWTLTDQQKEFLSEDNIRHVLAVNYKDTETAVRWNNNMQAFTEKLPFGLPVNISTDPRNGASKAEAEFKTGGSDISKWPEGLGMAATFSPELCREYANIISKEYRALGIATALSPQVDLATEPRWLRFEDTFGSHPQLVTDMARAYCEGMQTTDNAETGWGMESVSAMAKHWPGGGTGEGGRDAHYAFGAYAVYPGNRFELHLKSFLEGAFKLGGATSKAAAVMPYYTISYGIDTKYGKNVGNSYSRYIIKDLLREKYDYDGIVCTDWGITQNPSETLAEFGSRCHGVWELTEEERHFLAIENGVDQFGGNNQKAPILAAYEMGVEKYGKKEFDKRFRKSAYRLVLNMFRLGLFDNPFLDSETSKKIVACEEFCSAGYQAQLKSVVMLKNDKNILPLKNMKKVYTPVRSIKERNDFFLGINPAHTTDPLDNVLCSKYFERTENPQDADFALVFIESPLTDAYSKEDLEKGGNGYMPLSLQYRPYKAEKAREESIAGGDFRENFTNRSYKGKTAYAANEADLDLVIGARREMKDKPVVVVVRMHNAAVLAEIEPYADAIIYEFGVQQQAILDIITGKAQPEGLLPVQLPANMDTVEEHCEDTPFDMTPYTDANGNRYDFGFGLDWNGVISDERTRKYTKNNL